MIPMNSNLALLQRSGIRRYTNLAKEVPGCIMLTIGEPDFDTPEPVKEAVGRALAENRTHYAPNRGIEELLAAVAEKEDCTKEQLIITAGATEALFTALVGILNPGEEVVIPTPAFPLYESIVRIAGGVPRFLDTKSAGFQLTREDLRAVVSEKTKAIILNSPNNPTGAIFSDAALQAVKETVLGKDIFVICDNVYQQLCDSPCPDLSRDPDLRQQILLCQSFSKPYAMTGWRVGYLKGPENVMDRLLIIHAAQISSVPTFVQAACLTALEQDPTPMARSYARRRRYVCDRLKKMGLSFPKPEGAFYIFPDISRFSVPDEVFCTRLIREGGVATVPGSCFGCPGHIRISYACADEMLETGLDRLERFISQIGGNL